MPPPKKLPPELAAEAARLFEAISKRTEPLSEAGAKSASYLTQWDPKGEAAVLMDEFMTKGAQLGEVGGEGFGYDARRGHASGPVWPQWPDERHTAQVTQPLYDSLRPTTALNRGTSVNMGPTEYEGRYNSVLDAAADNVTINREQRPVSGTQAASDEALLNHRAGRPGPSSWPQDWHTWENIPAAVGTVGAGAALLGASRANAAEDDFTPAQGDDFTPVEDDFTPAAQSAGPADPDLADLQPDMGAIGAPPPTGMPELLRRPPEPAPAQGPVPPGVNPYDELGNSALGKLAFSKDAEWANPAAVPNYLLSQFKQTAIDPVVKWLQSRALSHYLDPQGGSGEALRKLSPGTAHFAELAAKPFIGTTPFNTQNVDDVDPSLLGPEGGLQKARDYYGGDAPVATMEFLTEGLGQLPFFVIPGAGKTGVVQGITGGVLSALPDPEANLAVAAGAGGALGLGLEVAGKVGSKLINKLAAAKDATAFAAKQASVKLAQREISVGPVTDDFLRQLDKGPVTRADKFSNMKPVAVAKPDELADAVAKLPVEDPAIARGRNELAGAKPEAPQPAVLGVVDVTPAGIVRKELSLTPSGPKARVLTNAEGFRRGAPVIGTDAANRARVADPAGEAAQAFWQVGPDGVTAAPGQWMPAHIRMLDAQDYDASFNDQRIFGAKAGKPEALVLVSDGQGGTARLIDVEDMELKKEILRQRQLIQVTLRDGSEHMGFYGSGHILVRPDANEFLPRAATKDMGLQNNPEITSIRVINKDEELAKVLRYGEDARKAAQAELARYEADAAAKQADIALGGDGSGGKLPPGPPMDPPPPPPPNPHNVDQLEGLKVRYAQGAFGKALSYAQKKLVNPTVRGVQDVADLAFSSHSVDTFQRLAPDTFKALNNAVPELARMKPHEQRAVHENLTRFIEGDIDSSTMRQRHPELNAQFHGLVESYKQKIAHNDARLRELGMLAAEKEPNLADLEAGPDYAVKLYWRFMMREPGAWANIARKDKQGMAAIKEAIKNDVYRKGQYMTRSEADRDVLAQEHLDFLLGDPEMLARAKADPEGAWAQAVSKAGGSLKQRQVMAWWKKAALGEIDSPLIRIAESMSRQEQLILQGTLWQEVSRNPKLATIGDNEAVANALGHTERLRLDPARFGKAAGMRVSKETFEAMVHAPLAQRNASTFVSKALNVLKYGQTVGNPGSWVTNFVANAQGAMLSNLVNPWSSPLKIGAGMHTFAKDLQAFKAAPGLKGAVPSSFVQGTGEVGRQRFTRAMELGVVGSDYSTAEFQAASADWLRTMEKESLRNNGRVNPMDMMLRVLKDGLNKPREFLARKYGAIDTLWKYATFTSGLEKGGIDLATGKVDVEKAIEFIGPRYRPGMLNEAIIKNVELEVAQRIHYSFPMLDRVGEGVAQAGKWAGLAVNPYLKVKFELMRNYAQLPARMLTEKGMAANMIGYAAIAGGLYYGLKSTREAMGVNQKEVDQSFAVAPSAVQRYKPGAVALWSRTDKGRLQFADMTSIFEPFSWIQGNPETALPARALANIAYSPIDGSLLEAPLAGLMNFGGMPIPGYTPKNEPEWKQDGANLLREGMMRLGPGIFRNTYTTAERGGVGFAPKGSAARDLPPQSPLTTGLNMALGPNRFFEAGSPEDKSRAIQGAAAEIARAEAELHRIGRMNEGQSIGVGSLPLVKSEAMAKQREILQQRINEMKKLQQTLGR